MAQISSNRTKILTQLMRKFNLSRQQLAAVILAIIVALVSIAVLIVLIISASTESFDRTDKQDSATEKIIAADNQKSAEEDKASEKTEDTHKNKETLPQMMVHVDGAVKSPGLYALQMANPRVNDAIQIAGGITEDANEQNINLASPVEDGQKIYIPRKGEENSTDVVSSQENNSAGNKQTGHTTVVDINRATTDELTNLQGVGEGLAKRIVADRQKNGSFKTIEDLMRVSGIGQKKFDQFKDNIRV